MNPFNRASFASCIVLACLMAGCHAQTVAPARTYPTTVTPAQMRQAIQSVYNNPKMTPAQKAATVNMLVGHLQVQRSAVNSSRAAP